jgi:hypothetical protein
MAYGRGFDMLEDFFFQGSSEWPNSPRKKKREISEGIIVDK